MPVWRVSAPVSLAALAAAAFLLLPLCRCQSFGGVNLAPAQVSPLLWDLNDAVDNVTQSLFPIINDRFGFCVDDASVSSCTLALDLTFHFLDLECRCGFGLWVSGRKIGIGRSITAGIWISWRSARPRLLVWDFFHFNKTILVWSIYIYTDAINESRWSVSYHTSCFGTWKGFHVLLFFSILGMRLKSVAQLDTEVEVLYVEYSAQYVRNGGAVWLAQRGEKYAENVSVVIPGCGYISQLNLWDLLAS